MANQHDDLEGWVNRRLQTLTPTSDLRPRVGEARARVHERGQIARRASRRRTWAAVFTGGLLVLVALPGPRAAAQRLLDRLTLGHIEVIETPRKDLPENVTDTLVLKPQPWQEEAVSTLDDAQRIAGFRPSLPPANVVPGTPKIVVIRQATLATAPLHVDTIERALASSGVHDVSIPREWEGISLSAEGGPAVSADYGDLEVIQTAAFHLITPPGFPFGRFMELTFRVFGRSEADARRLGEQLAQNPALVMHFPGASAVRDVPLQNGSGVLVGNPDGKDGMCFFWSRRDRIFILEADKLSEQRAATVANAIRYDGLP